MGKTLHQETLPTVDCTWQLVLSVAGVTLMRSNSVAVKALGVWIISSHGKPRYWRSSSSTGPKGTAQQKWCRLPRNPRYHQRPNQTHQ